MTNLADQAKTDVTQARTGFRAWCATNPFRYGLYCFGAGIALALLLLAAHAAL